MMNDTTPLAGNGGLTLNIGKRVIDAMNEARNEVFAHLDHCETLTGKKQPSDAWSFAVKTRDRLADELLAVAILSTHLSGGDWAGKMAASLRALRAPGTFRHDPSGTSQWSPDASMSPVGHPDAWRDAAAGICLGYAAAWVNSRNDGRTLRIRFRTDAGHLATVVAPNGLQIGDNAVTDAIQWLGIMIQTERLSGFPGEDDRLIMDGSWEQLTNPVAVKRIGELMHLIAATGERSHRRRITSSA